MLDRSDREVAGTLTVTSPPRPRVAKAAKGTLGIALFMAAWQALLPLIGLESRFYPAPADVWFARPRASPWA